MTKRTKKPVPPPRKPVDRGHGVEYAHYNNLPFQHPEMECLCGFTTEYADSWASAGEEMDEHIKEVDTQKKTKP